MKLSIREFKKSSGSALSESKGFTLIELLIVIAIIGILAAALIATLDPLEQIRKANDTNRKNAAAEYVSAVTRYYGSHQIFPWDASAPPPGPCGQPAATTLDTEILTGGCADVAIQEGELKASFRDLSPSIRSGLNGVITNYDLTTNSITACFVPESRSAQADPSARYDPTTFTSTCAFGVGTGCMWCAL